jgi:rfaE bifunctional protein kinase chain/domain
MIEMRLNKIDIENIKDKIKDKKIGVIGDGCLDIYWRADMKLSKLSRETPHYPLPIVEEKFSLGGASNVVNNLFTLGANIEFLTVIGNDWRGREFLHIINNMNLDNKYILVDNSRITPTYCKPIRSGISEVVYEDPRLDFENRTPINSELEDKIIENLKIMSKNIDILIVSDQFHYGIMTDKVISTLFQLKEKGLVIVVDSRENIVKYKGLFIKPNEVEVFELLDISPKTSTSVDDFIEYARELREINQNDMIITLGKSGAILIEEENIIHIPTIEATGEIDIVGCGDAFISGFSLGLLARLSKQKSIELANIIAGITIKKIGTTGDATLEEVIEKYEKFEK